MRVLLLGATGHVGHRVASELARAEEVEELLVAGRAIEPAGEIADLLGTKAKPLQLDVTHNQLLTEAMAPCDVTVSCAGPGYLLEGPCVLAAVEAHTPYVSLCDDRDGTIQALELEGNARDADVTVVTGCGMTPGLANILSTYALSRFDEVFELEVSVAISISERPGEASALHFLHLLGEETHFISNHDDATASSAATPRLTYFPDPVGWVETFRFGHPEVETLRQSRPPRGLVYRLGLTERAVMDATRVASTLGLLGNESGRRLWHRLTRPIAPLLAGAPPRGPRWSAIRVDAHGLRDGHHLTESIGVADHLLNLAALPLTEATLALGSRRVHDPGVSAPEPVFEATDFLRHLISRGIRVARLEAYSV